MFIHQTVRRNRSEFKIYRKKTGAETVKSVVGKYEAKIRVSRTRYRKIEVSKKRGGNGLVRLTPR